MSNEVYINGHRLDVSIYNELKQDLIGYTFNEISIEDIIKSYEYKGVEIAYIRRKEYENGYFIVIRDILTMQYYTTLWSNEDQYKEIFLNDFIEDLDERMS